MPSILNRFPHATCTYCGEEATALDHVIPLAYLGIYKRTRHSLKDCVPACRECNSLLGCYAYHTIPERAEYISDRLSTRYRKRLNGAVWSEEEIEELEGNLVRRVVTYQHQRLTIIDRIRHASTIAQTSLTIQDVWDIVKDGRTVL